MTNPSAQTMLADGINGCMRVAAHALDFLAKHERPVYGQQKYNAEHLLQLASELRKTSAAIEHSRAASAPAAVREAHTADIVKLREALQAQMQSTILLLSKYKYSQQEIEDCTSQARNALEGTIPASLPRGESAVRSALDAPRDGRSIMIYSLGAWSIASWNGRGHWNLEIDCATLAYDSAGDILTRRDDDVKFWQPLSAQPMVPTPKEASTAAGEDNPLEVWHGERKVTVYAKEVLRVWGVNIDTEMSSEPRSHEAIAAAFDWLYAAPPAAQTDAAVSQSSRDNSEARQDG